MIIFYIFMIKIFNSRFIAILGPILLISNPRIFADSFYNSKDIVFLSFFLITSYFAYSYLKKKKIKNFLLLAFFSACSINLRSIAIVIPMMVYIELILTSYQNKVFKKELIFLPALSLFFSLRDLAFLWENPIQSLLHVIYWFKELPNNQITNYYLGSDHNSMNTPWHYLIIWILIHLLFYLVLIILGIIIFAKKK